jgi:hypothetical protein
VQVAKFDSDAVAYREEIEVSYISVLCNTDILISHNKLHTCISKCVTIMRSIWRSQFFQTDVGNMHYVSIQVGSNLLSVLIRHTVQVREKKQDTKCTCVWQHTFTRICVMLQMILLIKLQRVTNCAKTWKPEKTLHFTPKV